VARAPQGDGNIKASTPVDWDAGEGGTNRQTGPPILKEEKKATMGALGRGNNPEKEKGNFVGGR